MSDKRIDWNAPQAKKLMSAYVRGIRALEKGFDVSISTVLGCTTDAVHIKARRMMKDNPDSRKR